MMRCPCYGCELRGPGCHNPASGALRPLGGVSGSHGDRSRQGGAEQAEHRYHAGLR